MTSKFNEISQISGGTFGQVWKCENLITKEIFAVKKLSMINSYRDIYKRIFREIIILRFLKSKYSITLCDIYSEENTYGAYEVCLVLPYMQHDLRTMMKEYQFDFETILKIIYQIILALDYLYYCGILHRDLKPSNIGLNEDISIKLLDYGLARDQNDDMTNYVVTRWYRPVEVFCTLDYTASIDMWSAGCILVELIMKTPLFPGNAPSNQVVKILTIMGMPDAEMLADMDENTKRGLSLFESKAAKTNNLETHISSSLKNFLQLYLDPYNEVYIELMELISQMLNLNPVKRIKPTDALAQPIFQRFSDILSVYQPDERPSLFVSNIHEVTDNEILQEMIENEIQNS